MEQLIHYRASSVKPTIKDNRRLTFYAATFGDVATVHERGQTFFEVVRPGAFQDTLRSQGEVVATINHSPTRIFARSTDTLLLQEDAKGLFATCWLPDDDIGNAVLNNCEAGNYTGCSFAFQTLKDQHVRDTVELLSVRLEDVSLIEKPYKPTYSKTDIHLRSDRNFAALLRRLRLLKLHNRNPQEDNWLR